LSPKCGEDMKKMRQNTAQHNTTTLHYVHRVELPLMVENKKKKWCLPSVRLLLLSDEVWWGLLCIFLYQINN